MGWDTLERTVRRQLAAGQYRPAFELLFEWCYRPVAHYGAMMLGAHNHHAVNEFFEQLWTQVGRELAGYAGEVPLRVWFWRLVYSIDRARAPQPPSAPAPGSFQGQGACAQWILSQLSPSQRCLVLVRSFDPEAETLSGEDLAQILRLDSRQVDQHWQELAQHWQELCCRRREFLNKTEDDEKESPHG